MAAHPTLRSIGVCALIALQSDPGSPLHEIDFNPHEQDRLMTFLESCIFDSKPNNDLSRLFYEVRQRIGAGIAELLNDTLNMATESVDSLIDLMGSLQGAVTDGVVDAVSAHGIFLRQVCLGFDALSFECVTLLWKHLKKALDEVDSWKHKSLGFHTSWPFATGQAEVWLHEGCVELAVGPNTSQQSFEFMEQKIRLALKSDPELSAAYFLRFLNCLKHGERSGALDALHLYFDYAMVKHNSPKDILQFSAILLAMTHNSFGEKSLALAATDEAVRVAQQSKDAACVAFALGWLFENSKLVGTERRELLKRCTKRAAQGQLQSLVAGANLALSKHYVEDSRLGPCAAWTSIMKVTCEQGADELANLDRPTFLDKIPDDTMESISRQRLISAGIWDSLCMRSMSELSSSIALGTENYLSSANVFAAIQNISRVALLGNAISINVKGQKNDISGVLIPCVYSVALSRLAYLRETMNLESASLQDPFLRHTTLILHEWAVNRGDLADANSLELALDSYLTPGIDDYDQIIFDVNFQKCLLLCRESSWDEARNLAVDLCRICEKKDMEIHRARTYVQLAMIELESNPKQFMAALPPLLHALSLAGRREVHGLHAIALSVLAKIFLRMKVPMKAIAVLEAAIPKLLESEHVWFQAEAFLVQSKAYFQLGVQVKTDAKKKRVGTALSLLQRSQELFETCHDFHRLREVFYLQGRVYTLLGQTSKSEIASRHFLKISSYLEKQGKSVSSNIIDSILDTRKTIDLARRPLIYTSAN